MATGFSAGIINAILDALCRGVTWTPPAALWVQPHIGDPGAAGTANQAAETTRQQAVFATAAAAGSIANTTALDWTDVAGSEDWTHCSVWSLATGGTFIGSGAVVADPLTAGNNFTVAVGGCVIALTPAS